MERVRKSPMERLRKEPWQRRGVWGKFLYRFYYDIWMFGFRIAVWHQFFADIEYLKKYKSPPNAGIVYWFTIWFMPKDVRSKVFRMRESFYGNKFLNIRGFSKRYNSSGLEY